MSGFAAVYELSNTPVDPGVLERVMNQLAHRGPDGRDECVLGHAALGHWHFWTTPEEVGERQPIELTGPALKLVLDGRLDNRSELLSRLNPDAAEPSQLSDAALILQAYAHWGDACLEHFIGEYAFVIVDENRGRLLCARDALGGRTLFYAWYGTCLIIASEPWAVVSAHGLRAEINENALPYYFAMKTPEDGQTLFKNVYEILPAHGMLVTASGSHSWRYWHPNPVKIRGKSDKEYAEEFLSLLETSVECRMRSTVPVGVLMSGGLDSGSVACLAARTLAPQPLTTISYIFDELVDCDERSYIEMIRNQWGIRSIQFPGDNSWPFKDWQNWPPNPNQPCGNPFRLLMQQVYQHAYQEGLRVLLTGGGGDQLYTAGINWLGDLLGEGQLLKAWWGLLSHIRYNGLRRTWVTGFLQRTARHMFNTISSRPRLGGRPNSPVWLTPLAREALQKSENDPASIMQQYEGLLGMGIARSYSGESFHASSYECELRHPYRDRRLVEFVMALPAYQLCRGLNKHILRAAMQGILPEAIRSRVRPNSYATLFLRGVEQEKTILQACLEDPDATWPKFICSDWMENHWSLMRSTRAFRREDIILWTCMSYEAWSKFLASSTHFCEV